MLKRRGAWWGFIGGVMMLYGVLGLAVQKTAQCLVSTVILVISWFPLGFQFIKGDLE
jgi:hypothetical protein